MPRLERLPQISRNNLLTFPAQVNDTTPFVRPGKPLAASRLAIVTTAGLHVRGDPPFSPGDQTYRVIPSDTPTADIVQSHTSIGFDRVAIMRDINISFPIDRLREPVAKSAGGSRPRGWTWRSSRRPDRTARTPAVCWRAPWSSRASPRPRSAS